MRVSHTFRYFLSWSGQFQNVLGFKTTSSIVVIVLSFVSPPEILAGESTTANHLPPEVIAENLVQWSKQIDSFSMKWDVAHFTLRREPYPIDHQRVHHQVKEFVWTKQGCFWFHQRNYVTRNWFTRQVQIHDGTVEYQASYAGGFSVLEKPAKLRLGAWVTSHPSSQPPKEFRPLEGIWDSIHLTWNFSKFQTEEIDSYGTERWNERDCTFIQFTNGPRIVFDPDHNCLPCRIEHTGEQDTMVYVVDDYREVEPGIWFPSAGHEEVRSTNNPAQNGIREWKVVDLRINHPIPVSAFRIKPVVGTNIEDTFTGYQFTYGRDMPLGTLESGLNERWVHYMKHGGPHPFPIHHHSRIWRQWRFLALVSALVFCTGILAWRTILPKGVL